MFVPRGTAAPAGAPGMIAVPLCGRAITPGTRITPEHLLDPATNRPHLVHLRPGDARRLGLLTDAAQIIGRIAGRRKDPDTAFKEEDFTPADASPPPAAAATTKTSSAALGTGGDRLRTARRSP
jgi:hypothetical protein